MNEEYDVIVLGTGLTVSAAPGAPGRGPAAAPGSVLAASAPGSVA